MFPRRPPGLPVQRQQRSEGDPKRAISARVSGDLLAWIVEGERAGFSTSTVLVRSLELARTESEVLGDLWWEMERRAAIEGQPVGTVIARLALQALEAEKKRK